MLEVRTYLTPNNEEPYKIWLDKLSDRNAVTRILVRVERMAKGNYGDIKPLGDGVWEARIDWGQATAFTMPRQVKRSSCC